MELTLFPPFKHFDKWGANLEPPSFSEQIGQVTIFDDRWFTIKDDEPEFFVFSNHLIWINQGGWNFYK